MVDAEEDVLLVLDVLNLLESDDVRDGQDLERPIVARGALLPAQDDAAESPRPCRTHQHTHINTHTSTHTLWLLFIIFLPLSFFFYLLYIDCLGFNLFNLDFWN